MSLEVTALQVELYVKVQEALKMYDDVDVLLNNAVYIEVRLIEDIRLDFPNIHNLLDRLLLFLSVMEAS